MRQEGIALVPVLSAIAKLIIGTALKIRTGIDNIIARTERSELRQVAFIPPCRTQR